MIRRDFAVDEVNRKWSGDGGERYTDEGKLPRQRARVASRRIVGFAMSPITIPTPHITR